MFPSQLAKGLTFTNRETPAKTAKINSAKFSTVDVCLGKSHKI